MTAFYIGISQGEVCSKDNNLVFNGNFEKYNDAEGWVLYDNITKPDLERKNVYSGKFAISLTKNGMKCAKKYNISVAFGKKYLFSGWIFANTGKGKLIIAEFNTKGEWLNKNIQIGKTSSGKKWEKIAGEYIPQSRNVTSVAVAIVAIDGNILVDNIIFRELKTKQQNNL